MSITSHTGSCHCGRVRFQADVDLGQPVNRCHCSYCEKTRSWSIALEPAAFRLLSGEADVVPYQLGPKSGQHMFCKHCGVHTFGRTFVAELGRELRSVSMSCLDGVEAHELSRLPFRFKQRGNDNDILPKRAEFNYLAG